MREMLDNLDPRQRLAVFMGAIAVALLLGYLLGWQPFATRVERLEKTVSEQQLRAQWMQSAAQDVLRLRAARSANPQHGLNGQSLLALIDDSAKRSQLGNALKRVEPDGAHGVRVWLEQAPFDDTIRWLGELKNNYGVRITSITVDQQGAAGLVNVRLILEEGGG